MADESNLFVARDSDVDTLKGLWAKTLAGEAQTLRLQAPFGGGRRAVANEFLRGVATENEDAFIWRVQCQDQENGMNWLVRMYGALVAGLSRDLLRRGKAEMILNSALPGQPKRVQSWYQQFIASLKEAKTDDATGQVQLRLPQDNPLLGLVEIVTALAAKMPIVLELQSPYVVNSLALALFIETLHAESRERGGKVFTILFDEPESEVTNALYPMPLLDFYGRRSDELATLAVAPWGADEVQQFLESKGLKSDAGRIAEITKGRPGFVAELVEILEEKGQLESDLSEVTFASLAPMNIDEGELEIPEGEPAEGEKVHVGPDHAGRVAYLAALLGNAFPSNLVADMGGYDRESVDDLLDAMSDLFEEMQFSKEMNTWLYKFVRGSWREGVLELNDNEEGHDLARRVGLFMERFLVPRGYGFIVKTAKIYAEHGAGNRASIMRSLALTHDNNDVWGMSYDLTRYFDEITWPDPLLRTIYMNLLDRLVNGGNIPAAEQVHKQVTEWATAKDDRELTAWLLFNGSRIDTRRQDLFRARDRANDALKLYEALDNKIKQAEVHNHIASIELQDGNPNAAQEAVNKAIEVGAVDTEDGQKALPPGILATAEHIRGTLARSQRNFEQASEHFRRANEVAGQAGIGGVALDSGLAFGEALFAQGKVNEARDVLERVVGIAQQLRNPVRERQACELLAQAEGRLGNLNKALPLAERTLQLTQALKFEQALPIDLYNLGFFHFMNKKPTEALTFFNQSAQRIAALGAHPVVKELHYFKGLAHLQVGQLDEAKKSLKAGLQPFQAAKDWRKMCSALENLAIIEQQQGNVPVAKKLLADAIQFAKNANLKDERKALKKRLDGLA